MTEHAAHDGGIDTDVKQHPAGRDMTEVVGMPPGTRRRPHVPPCPFRRSCPETEELSAFGGLPVGQREEQRIVACALTDSFNVVTQVGGQAGREERGALLLVLGRLDASCVRRLLHGSVDVHHTMGFELDVTGPKSDELSPASATAVLQAHRQTPHGFAEGFECFEERGALGVTGKGVPRHETNGLALELALGGVGDGPHRVDLAGEPATLVGERDQGAHTRAETLHCLGRELPPSHS
jgi:hypothetical protein